MEDKDRQGILEGAAGDWKWINGGQDVNILIPDGSVLSVGDAIYNSKESEARARKICNAVNSFDDLLGAAKASLKFIEKHFENAKRNAFIEGKNVFTWEVLENLSAAIAKAESKSTGE